MFKKIIFLLITFIFLSSIVLAGTIVEFVCDKCGFKSTELDEGCGKAGINYTIVYCDTCKKFFSIPTEIAFKTKLSENFNVIKPIGNEVFLGEKRLVYPCPQCKSKAFVYDRTVCPICKKGKLQNRSIGIWD